jgi:ankyrin repeat protein
MAIVENRPPADVMGRVPLHYAALFGDLRGAESLIAAGADVHVVDHDGQTPLHYAAQGNAATVAELLLNHGAVVDAADHDGNTPLWNAAMRTRGEGPVVSLLLAHGGDPLHVNDQGRTPSELTKALGGGEITRHVSA